MSNNRGPWATSGAQSVSVSDHAAMAVQVGALPTPPASITPTTTLAQALAYLSASGALSPALAALAALTPAADRVPYYTSASTAALATLGAWARTDLLPVTSQAGARAALGLAAVSWTGAYADLTGAPASLPASDVYSWAKQPTKPAYSFSEISGTASASQITAVNTAGQHDNDTSPASTAFVLLHSGGFRRIIPVLSSDVDITVNYSEHGGTSLKSAGKCILWKIPASGTDTSIGQYPAGDSVVIQVERDYLTIADFGLNGGNVHTSGGSFQQNLILPGSSGGFYHFVSHGPGNPWQMMGGAKAMAQTIDLPGGVNGEEQSPYYAFKLPDLHSSSHSTRIELSGAGCRSTTSGYFGRAGAYIDATITASYRPGHCLEFVVGSNSTGATGSSTLALLPLSSYTITAPGGGSGNAVASTYSSGLARFLAAVSTRPTSTASNSALDAGSQGGPMGGPGQKPDLRNGYGGGGAVFDGAGSGQYGAGAGVARLHYSSPYSRPKVIFALGCNAANGSTVFKDFGPSAAAVTASGGVTHSTAQKYAGVNSIWLNGGYLSIGTPSIANFTAYSHVHIAMQWRYAGAAGMLVLFDTRTTSGGAGGFSLYFDTTNGIIGVYERERVIASAPIAPSGLINKFNLIEVEIVPGVARAFFRVWLNKSMVCYGFSEDIAAIESTDSFLIGKDVSMGITLNDYIVGPCIMVRL